MRRPSVGACHLVVKRRTPLVVGAALLFMAPSASAIVAGTTAPADTAVVMLLAYAPGVDPFAGGQPVKSCSATLVSPHVLATAAHCVGGEFPNKGAGYTYWVYAGPDVSQPSPKPCVRSVRLLEKGQRRCCR